MVLVSKISKFTGVRYPWHPFYLGPCRQNGFEQKILKAQLSKLDKSIEQTTNVLIDSKTTDRVNFRYFLPCFSIGRQIKHVVKPYLIN